MSGRTIQIFLPFGSPRGIKIAEITNRTVQAILIPRNQLAEAEAREEIQSVGVYFLFGKMMKMHCQEFILEKPKIAMSA